jgi:hypothetical protein
VRLYDYAASANCYKARLLLALLERAYERAVSAWLDRVRALPGFVDDLLPYPDNARPGRRPLDLRPMSDAAWSPIVVPPVHIPPGAHRVAQDEIDKTNRVRAFIGRGRTRQRAAEPRGRRGARPARGRASFSVPC